MNTTAFKRVFNGNAGKYAAGGGLGAILMGLILGASTYFNDANAGIKELEHRTTVIEQRVSTLEQSVSTLSDKIDQNRASIDKLGVRIDKLTEKVSSVLIELAKVKVKTGTNGG